MLYVNYILTWGKWKNKRNNDKGTNNNKGRNNETENKHKIKKSNKAKLMFYND